MSTPDITNEYTRKVNEIINFILSHLGDDLSLDNLARRINYSRFHFQKIFKEAMGESPKQFIIRMRLETAAHGLVVYRDRSVTEIALNSGFSSSATFARAFKQFYGVSAEEYRKITGPVHQKDKIWLEKIRPQLKKKIKTIVLRSDAFDHIDVRIAKEAALSGIFVNAKLDDPQSIRKAFLKAVKLAETNDLRSAGSKLIGMAYPHHNLYRAVVTVDLSTGITGRVPKIEIPGGRYAVFRTRGDFDKTFETLAAFATLWLKNSGYRLADTFYLEVPLVNPAAEPYESVEKEIYSPIAPVD